MLLPVGRDFAAIEIKRSSTYRPELIKSLRKASSLSPRITRSILAFAGERLEFSDGLVAIPFDSIGEAVAALR